MIYRTGLLCLLGVLSLPTTGFAESSIMDCARRKHPCHHSSPSHCEGPPGPMGLPGPPGPMGAPGTPFSRPVAYGDFYVNSPVVGPLSIGSMDPILVGAAVRIVNGIDTVDLASSGELTIQTTGTYEVSYLVDATAPIVTGLSSPETFSVALLLDGQVVPISLRSVLIQALVTTETQFPTIQIQGQIQLDLVAGQSLSLINASPVILNMAPIDPTGTPVVASLTIQRIK